jgi:hypothetical protein
MSRTRAVEGGQLTSAERAKDKRLQTIYNTTLDAQNKQRDEQNNACAICGRDFATFTSFQDHEHKCCPRRLKKFCGKCNRGLICFLCNKWLTGVLERQATRDLSAIELCQRVIAYLEKWNKILKGRGCYEKPEVKKAAPIRRKKKSVR